MGLKPLVYYILTSMLLSIVCCLPPQYLNWDFSDAPPTGVENTVAAQGSPNPQFGVDYGAVPGAKFSKTGFLFEGDNIACAQPSNVFNLGTSFTISLWVYITDTQTEQSVFCKENIHGDNQVSHRLCIKIRTGTIWAMVNDGAGAFGNTDERDLDVQPTKGWNLIMVNFDEDGGDSRFRGRVLRPDGTVQNGAQVTSNLLFQDSDDYHLCIGGQLVCTGCPTADYDVDQGFNGVVNTLNIYDYQLTAAQFTDHYSTACGQHCEVCRQEENALCFEQFIDQRLAFIEFNVPDYRQLVEDQSVNTNTNNFELSGDTVTDPYYVHNQGLYFDGTNSIDSENAILLDRGSFTLDFWLRPTVNPTDGQKILQKFDTAGNSYFTVAFKTGQRIEVTLNGESLEFPISYTEATGLGKWHFLSVAMIKKDTDSSQACIVFNKDAVDCSGTLFTSAYADSGQTDTIRLGEGYSGLIKLMHIYDYPKMFESVKYQIRAGGDCKNFNGQNCNFCELKNDKKCFSNCGLDEFGANCRDCHDECKSCYGSTLFNCFSCDTTTHNYFTDSTFCQEKCGDGRNYGLYECDDGNNDDGDGCSSQCNVEMGWACTGGTPTNPDTCTEICGDGIQLGNYECDDGNNEDDDGCSSTCQIEDGYECFTLSQYGTSDCIEICGNGQTLGSRSAVSGTVKLCDDGNNVNGDGCDEYCRIEDGYYCDNDGCYEICGNGRTFNLECDDGNVEDGDGCSSNCEIEKGYACTTSAFAPSVCTIIRGPQIISHTLSRDNSLIRLQFSESFFFVDNFHRENDLRFRIEGHNTPYDIQIELVNDIEQRKTYAQSHLDFRLRVAEDQQLFDEGNEHFVVEFETTQYYSQDGGKALVDFSYQIALKGKEAKLPLSQLIIKYVILVSLLLAILGWLVLGCLGYPIAGLWHLVAALQIVYYIPLTQSYIQSFIREIGQAVQFINFELVPLTFLLFPENALYQTTPYKYHIYGIIAYQPHVLIANTLIILGVFAGIIVSAILIIQNATKSPKLRHLSQRLKEGALVYIGTLVFTKWIYVGIFGIVNMKLGGTLAIAVGAVLVAIGAAFALYVAWQLLMMRSDISEGKVSPLLRSRGIFGYFSKISYWKNGFYVWFMGYRIAFAVVLVVAMDYLPYQMVILLVLQFIFLFFVSKTKPYKDKYFNIMMMIDEMGVLIALGLACNTLFLNTRITPQRVLIVGWVYAAVIEIVLLLNIVMIVVFYRNRKGNPEVEDEAFSEQTPMGAQNPNKESSRKMNQDMDHRNDMDESDVDIDPPEPDHQQKDSSQHLTQLSKNKGKGKNYKQEDTEVQDDLSDSEYLSDQSSPKQRGRDRFTPQSNNEDLMATGATNNRTTQQDDFKKVKFKGD